MILSDGGITYGGILEIGGDISVFTKRKGLN